MKRMIVLLLIFAFALTACTQTPITDEQEQELMNCSPYKGGQFCIMEYDPVCAKLSTGEWKTFGNACTACISGEDVVGYKMGEC